MKVDLLIHNCGQLLTLASAGPKIGPALRDVGLISKGAIAVREGRITLLGPEEEVRRQVTPQAEIDAQGRVVMPGFVDPHNHLVFAGDRVEEFEQRLEGASYQEIAARGGGILSSVRATRAASFQDLLAQSRGRLDRMLAQGTTTAEAKTGYGLSLPDELRLLQIILELNRTHPIDLVPTFLGAHAVPPEYAGKLEEYVDLVVEEMLPAVRDRRRELNATPFCDVFCDEGAFSAAQARRILSAAQRLGLGIKIHAEEFARTGGARVAAELGATSADHLIQTDSGDWAALAAVGVMAVLLPGTPFGLGLSQYAPAREMIAAGVSIALGTDLNPGTCYCESMPTIIALASRTMRLAPAEAISAATLNAAHAIGRAHEVGSLEVGKRADVLILDTDDYRDLAYRLGGNPVALVIKDGREVASNSVVLAAKVRPGAH